jgi:hypothetical protein
MKSNLTTTMKQIGIFVLRSVWESVWDTLKKQAHINSEHPTAVVLQTGWLHVADIK